MSAGARKTALIAAGSALALAGFGAYAWRVSQRQPIMELYVWDTPGYPAVLIRTPDDRRILVNGGSNADIVRRLTAVLPFYSRRIDLVIATNESAKAVTGLIEAANRYDIGAAVVRSATGTDPAYAVFMGALETKGVSYAVAEKGKALALGGGAVMEVLSAYRDMVLLVRYGDASFLLVGKAPLKAQNEAALALASSSPVDALAIGANPIPSNLSKKLVASARPKRLIYSASETAKGPTKEKLAFLAGILEEDRFDTKKTGGVRIFSDGERVSAEPI